MISFLNILPGLKPIAQSVGFAIVMATASISSPPDALAACFSGAEARSIVSANGLMPLGQVVAQVRRNGAQVSDARLCSGGSGYIYRLTVVTRDGRVKQMNVNARGGY